MKTILFQGDSITDTGRSHENNIDLGRGYANLIAAELGYKNPNQYTFYNRGVGGNRVLDMYARWSMDAINLAPDYISILIGVNDVWHELSRKNGIEVNKFKKIYKMILEETKEALPETKIFLMKPYVMKHTATEEHWDYFKEEVAKRGQAVGELSEEFSLPVIDLQASFDEALKKAPVEFWTPDGVHPTPAGHSVIAHAWLSSFEKYIQA